MTDHATAETELAERIEQWSAAIVANDPARIDRFVSPDWVLVTPESGIVDREFFLEVVASGRLRHDTMSHEILRVRSFADGQVAVVTTRGRNSGMFDGEPIVADEWTTDVFERRDGAWRCTLTHLTPVNTETRPKGNQP